MRSSGSVRNVLNNGSTSCFGSSSRTVTESDLHTLYKRFKRSYKRLSDFNDPLAEAFVSPVDVVG